MDGAAARSERGIDFDTLTPGKKAAFTRRVKLAVKTAGIALLATEQAGHAAGFCTFAGSSI